MAELKTKVTKASVAKFIDGIEDPQVRADCKRIAAMMKKASGAKAEMWGTSIIGFGRWRYYGKDDPREWPQIAFSPRKANITLYVLNGFPGQDALLKQLGNPACGKGCLYVKRLGDLHQPTLAKLISKSLNKTKQVEKNRTFP